MQIAKKQRARPSQGVYVYPRVRGTKKTWVVEHRPGLGQPKQYRIRDTKTEANQVADVWRAELRAAETPNASRVPRMTVDDAWEHYRVRAKFRLREGALDTYATTIAKHILPALGAVPVADLEPGMVRRLIDDLLGAGVHPKTAKNAVGVLRSVMAQLVSEGVLPSNPASIQRGWIPTKPAEPKSLTREQLVEFLAASRTEPYEHLITFLAFTGVRLGEALALRWSEVDLEQKTAQIVRSVRLSAENAPKTRFGRRAIDLSKSVVEMMKTMPRDHELVFHQEDGGFVNARHLHHVFRRISKRAGLKPVHPHMLRHTWATQMLNSEAPLNYVSRALGHHSVAFTAAVYASAQPEPRHHDVDRFIDSLKEGKRVFLSRDAARAAGNQVGGEAALPQAQAGADSDSSEMTGIDQAPDGADAAAKPLGDLDEK